MKGFVSHEKSTSTLLDLWQARYLIRQLIIRDLTVRYRHTLLGWLWALINPFVQLGVYYCVFGMLVRINPPDYHAPYPLVLVSGLIMWMFFYNATNAIGDSLFNNLHLVKKIFFPRVGLTLSGLGTSLFDFILGLVCVYGMLVFSNAPVSLLRIPLLVIMIIQCMLLAWGTGCIISLLRLRFRDFRHIMPLFFQVFFYFTPIVWTPGILPNSLRYIAELNPLYGPVALMRFVLIDGPLPTISVLLYSGGMCISIAVLAYYCFTHYESLVLDRE